MGLKDDPNGLVARYLALRNDPAVMANGVVDWAILDQKQQAFKDALTDPQDKAIVEDFTRFDHDDSVKAYFDAKDLLRTAGYWAVEQETFARQQAAVARVAPAAQSHDQLEAAQRAAELEGRRVDALRLKSLIARLNSETKRNRERLRRNNAELDAALSTAYGATPLHLTNILAQRSARLTPRA